MCLFFLLQDWHRQVALVVNAIVHILRWVLSNGILSLLKLEELLLAVIVDSWIMCPHEHFVGHVSLNLVRITNLILSHLSDILVWIRSKLLKLSRLNLWGHIWHLIRGNAPIKTILIVPKEILSVSIPLLVILNEHGRLRFVLLVLSSWHDPVVWLLAL